MNQVLGAVRSKLLIGAELVESEARAGDLITVTNPYDLSIVGTAPIGTAKDINRAVASAKAAFCSGEWAAATSADRADALERFAHEIERRGNELAQLVTAEIGQPAGLSNVMSVIGPVATLRYYAGLARDLNNESLRPTLDGTGHTTIRKEPRGVVAVIVPWNYPQALLMSKVAPALAAGCTVVIKPAEETSLDVQIIADAAIAAKLPKGVINIVTGDRSTGANLVAHPGIDKVAFTGSTEAGKAIASVCGGNLTPVTLELGGKSAAVVLEDADSTAVAAVLKGMSFMNSGQTCFLLSRVLVPESRAGEFEEALEAVARSLRLGDPADPGTEQGPLVSRRIRDRVEGYIAGAHADGAKLLTGGDRPDEFGNGFFARPTVFSDVNPASRLAQEEVFGPVVALMTYRSEDEAIRLANDSRFGLGGAVFSPDSERALTVARQIRSGTVGINSYRPDPAAPFGGYKDSGLGRENGPEGLDAYLHTKSIFR